MRSSSIRPLAASLKSPWQLVELPMSSYAGAKDRTVSVREDYSLTLFGLATSYSLPALGGSARAGAVKLTKAGIVSRPIVDVQLPLTGNLPGSSVLGPHRILRNP